MLKILDLYFGKVLVFGNTELGDYGALRRPVSEISMAAPTSWELLS
jgi:hypothetical protein